MKNLLKDMNMENLLKDKKKLIMVGGAILAIILVIIIITVISGGGNGKKNKATLEGNLTKLANKFYEEQYYTLLEDKSILQGFKDSGVNITITHLDVIVPVDEETKKLLDNRKCNYDNTKLIIYPKEPYGKTDYTVKVELACEK